MLSLEADKNPDLGFDETVTRTTLLDTFLVLAPSCVAALSSFVSASLLASVTTTDAGLDGELMTAGVSGKGTSEVKLASDEIAAACAPSCLIIVLPLHSHMSPLLSPTRDIN